MGHFQRIIDLFTQKIVTKLSKIWVRDPGSGKNIFRIPDAGVKKAPDPESATLKKSTGCPDTRKQLRRRKRNGMVTRGIAGPEREVVPEQLHDEGGVLVRVLVQGV